MTKNITKTAQAIFIKQHVKMFITEYFHYRITFQFGQHRLKIDLVELASQVSTPIESETSLLPGNLKLFVSLKVEALCTVMLSLTQWPGATCL